MKAFMTRILLLVSLFHMASSHGFMSSPRSRNYLAYAAYNNSEWWNSLNSSLAMIPQPEDCPHCLNLGGKIARCGYGNGRNYDEPKTINGHRMPFVSQATYQNGDEIDIVTEITVYHKGHFEFKICPLRYPDEVASQECFDRHPLTFVEDLLYDAGKDNIYPYRAYLAGDFDKFVHRMKLPDGITGSFVLLQWHWLTAISDSCFYPGYVEYFESNPTMEDNASLIKRLNECPQLSPDGGGVPEQFWNCAEITIVPKTSIENHYEKNDIIGKKKDKKDKNHNEQDNSMLPQDTIHHESDHAQYGQDERTKDKKDKKKDEKNIDEISTAIPIHHENMLMSESQIFTEQHDSLESFQGNEPNADSLRISVQASYDAIVSKKSRNTNIRSHRVIQISGAPRVQALIRFDLSEEIEKLKLLKSATLKIFTLSTLTSSTQVSVRPVMGSFNASEITWNSSLRGHGPSNAESKAAVHANSKTWINFDVTNSIKWSIDNIGSSAVTLRLSTKNSRTLTFASNNYSGGSYAPQLVLEIKES